MGMKRKALGKVEHHVVGNTSSNETGAEHCEITNGLVADRGAGSGNVGRGIPESQNLPEDNGKTRVPVGVTKRVHLVKSVELDREKSNNTTSGNHRCAKDAREGILGDSIREFKGSILVFLPEGESETVAHGSYVEVQKFDNGGFGLN